MADVVLVVLVGGGSDADTLEGKLPRRIDNSEIRVERCADAAGARGVITGVRAVVFLIGESFLDHLQTLGGVAPVFCIHSREPRESRGELLDNGASEIIEIDSVRTDLLAAVIRLALCLHEVRTLHTRAESRLSDLENRLHSHKMEAVGRLAGGVAHEFNNTLTAITGCADLLLARTKDQPELRHDIYEIKTAAARASSITRQLLTFSRRHPTRPHIFDLRTVIKGMEPALRRLVGSDVRLEIEVPASATYIRAEAAHIEQIVGNLAVNARDAMPAGGRLLIRVHEPRDQWVRLTVADTGQGIEQDVLPRIFEPFFTTKGPEQGAGLGLSIVYSLVRQCGGQIAAQSSPSEGATFEVLLPRVDAPSPAKGDADQSTDARTILLVEDQDVVRSVTRRLLEAAGFRVIEARRGEEALALSQDRLGEVDLLLTDVVMPVLSGVDIAERLAERRPDLHILYMSGFTRDEVLHDGRTDLPAHFLQKPFTKDQLLARVRDAIMTGTH